MAVSDPAFWSVSKLFDLVWLVYLLVSLVDVQASKKAYDWALLSSGSNLVCPFD